MTLNLQRKTTQATQIPYRMAFAGGWIDQPFVSKLNPTPPGSMVVVSLKPNVQFIDQCGMGTSTRKVAMQIWGNELPKREPAALMHELYSAENVGKSAPSGSQDMAGIIYPGINRLDYDSTFEGGYFPIHIETNRDPDVISWLEKMISIVLVKQRPLGYDPLQKQNLDPTWIQRLGQTGKDCFDAIVAKDPIGLGASMNACMVCWQNILPNTVLDSRIDVDLLEILSSYQKRYYGAMYSGCGGGYLFIVSDKPVPNSFKIEIRIA